MKTWIFNGINRQGAKNAKTSPCVTDPAPLFRIGGLLVTYPHPTGGDGLQLPTDRAAIITVVTAPAIAWYRHQGAAGTQK
jgi:hypothetical protein